MNRRRALSWLHRLLAGLTGLAVAWPVLSFITWRRTTSRTVIFEPGEQSGRVCKRDVWLIRAGDGHIALDARCPHLCCVVFFDEADGGVSLPLPP